MLKSFIKKTIILILSIIFMGGILMKNHLEIPTVVGLGTVDYVSYNLQEEKTAVAGLGSVITEITAYYNIDTEVN